MSGTFLMKHRDEVDVFEVDLSRRLSGMEIVTEIQSVRVSRNRGLDLEDVTSAFVESDKTELLDDRIVVFTIKAATPPSSQRVGEYTVYLRVLTSQGRVLVATVPLFVIRAGATVP
jgi:archaellum biogenesis ATPase FlaH